MSSSLLSGRKAVVTGSASGIGRAIATSLAAEGACLALLDRSADGIAAVAAEIRQATGAETPFCAPCDVRSGAAVDEAFTAASAALGGIDILVCAAGIREIVDSLAITHEQWDETIAVDLSGTFYCCQAAARVMSTSGGGAIINVASVTGLMGEQARPAYTAAKHGVLGLTKTLACDLAKYGIRVNAICPGLIRTPLTEPYFDSPAFADGLKASIPLGTYGEPRQIAAAAVFLASAQADYITGIALPVDGGFLAEKAFVSAPPGSPTLLRIHTHGAPIPGLPHPDNARRKGRLDARARFRIRS